MERKQHNYSMKNNGVPCPFAPVNYVNNYRTSEWLQATLADLNKRMEAVMTLLKEDGNKSAPAQICNESSSELIKMLEEIDRSYCHLAQKYKELISHSYHFDHPGSVPSSFSDSKKKKSLVEMPDDSDVECHLTDLDSEYLNKLADELMSIEQCKIKLTPKLEITENHMDEKDAEFSNKEYTHVKIDDCDLVKASEELLEGYEKNSWYKIELQFMKLMEENLQKQTELARRNIEKKVIINRLQLEVEHLKTENRALLDCISCLKVGEKQDQFQVSKPRALLFGKFFGCS